LPTGCANDISHDRLGQDDVARLLGIGDRRQSGFPCASVADPLVMFGRKVQGRF
jgi:hypothetical protein